MMSRHFALNSELTGAIAKRLPHAKNQLSAPGSFSNQFVTEIYILTIKTRLMCICYDKFAKSTIMHNSRQFCKIVDFATIMHNCSFLNNYT